MLLTAELAAKCAPEAAAEETLEFNQKILKMLETQEPIFGRNPADVRVERESGKSVWGPIKTEETAQKRTISGPKGDVNVRVFVPEQVKGVYLHIHGGGWTFGGAHHSDVPNWALAQRCNVAVVSVDYRKAPEDPYPAAPDDCEAVAVWLTENAAAEFGGGSPLPIIIGGESAGAHLSTVTLLRMKARLGNHTGFCAANLFYGMYDLGQKTASVRNWGQQWLILSTPIIDYFCNNFLPDGIRRDVPDVSPLLGDLKGMPPALFSVGTQDPLIDDSLYMASAWAAAGNKSFLEVYPGAVHGFERFPLKVSTQAVDRAAAFINDAIAGTLGQ